MWIIRIIQTGFRLLIQRNSERVSVCSDLPLDSWTNHHSHTVPSVWGFCCFNMLSPAYPVNTTGTTRQQPDPQRGHGRYRWRDFARSLTTQHAIPLCVCIYLQMGDVHDTAVHPVISRNTHSGQLHRPRYKSTNTSPEMCVGSLLQPIRRGLALSKTHIASSATDCRGCKYSPSWQLCFFALGRVLRAMST